MVPNNIMILMCTRYTCAQNIVSLYILLKFRTMMGIVLLIQRKCDVYMHKEVNRHKTGHRKDWDLKYMSYSNK